MSEPLRIAIAGLGTVGVGVVKILQQNQDIITHRAGRPIEIVAVSARDKNRDRGVDLSAYDWSDDVSVFANDDRIDVVVELIGGSDGVARSLVEKSLSNGKSVVTANKALVAHYGLALAALSEKNAAPLMYEAAVAGGIPIVKALKEGFAANNVTAVYGILNGTCNYILSTMEQDSADFEDVLADAQKKGFAEADPSFDVDGIDTAHKLCILSALAFGIKPDFSHLEVTGIRNICIDDIFYAAELGYRIKLLGVARNIAGHVAQSVTPCLVPMESSMGSVGGVFNAVFVEGDFVDKGVLTGRGAGEGPTASAVVADLVDLARGICTAMFGIRERDLKPAKWLPKKDMEAQFYIHLIVLDRPGVLADISAIMRDHKVSMESVIQRSRNPEKPVSIVMTTHTVSQETIESVIKCLGNINAVVKDPTAMRIERLE